MVVTQLAAPASGTFYVSVPDVVAVKNGSNLVHIESAVVAAAESAVEAAVAVAAAVVALSARCLLSLNSG
jgi:hypothetical protein